MIKFVTKFPHYLVHKNFRVGIVKSKCNIRSYSSGSSGPVCPPPKPKKKEVNHGTAYTVGALTLVSVATIGYAKYDPDFRRFMGEMVPGFDGFLKFIFQEERPFADSLAMFFEGVNEMFVGKRTQPAIRESESDYTPPRAVFPSLAKEEKEEKFNEIRVQKDPSTVDIVTEKPKKMDVITAYHPKSIGELEKKIGESAAAAIASFNKAETALKRYNQDIDVIVEDSVERLTPRIWISLKKKTEDKENLLVEAEKNAKKAIENLETFQSLLDDPGFTAPETAKATARRNIKRVMDDINTAREHYEEERRLSNITEKYWKKVQQARCHFIDELEILFPDFDVTKKKLSLKPSDVDLFVVYAFAHVLFYQKELQKLDTLGKMKLTQALEAAKKGDPNFSITETAIKEGIEVEKRKLAEEFQKKCLALRKETERELRHRLKCQEQAHMDHLADALLAREQELERDYNRKMDEQASQDQAQHKMQMAGMVARMKGMRNAIAERAEADKIAHQSQVLWSACQALHRAVKTSVPGVPWTEQMRPLQSEVVAIKQAAAESDELVKTVLAGIPNEAVDRGVYPEGAIRERFLKVERVARRLALVPEEGGRLPLYFLSFLQSMLLINSANPIPQAELADENTDFSKLDTYDILQRARYWLDRGNYLQTLKYMNLLKGASRCVANEWMNETRILLETQQAAETLMAHAVAGGLLHL